MAGVEERRHVLNEKTDVRLPISSVDEWTQKERTTLGIASGAFVATGLVLKHQCKHFLQKWFHMQMSAKRRKKLSLPFQAINLLSLKDDGASFFSNKLLVQHPCTMGCSLLLHLGERVEMCFCMGNCSICFQNPWWHSRTDE